MELLYQIAYKLLKLYWRVAKPITIGVRLLMIHQDAIVLVKPSYDNMWHLPGGGLKRGETLDQAVRREAAEEVGGLLDHLQLFGVYSSFYQVKSDHVVVFISYQFTWDSSASGEIEQVAQFPLDALPSTASAGTKRRVAEYLQGASPYYGTW